MLSWYLVLHGMCTKALRQTISTEHTANKTLGIYRVLSHKMQSEFKIDYLIRTVSGVTLGSRFLVVIQNLRYQKSRRKNKSPLLKAPTKQHASMFRRKHSPFAWELAQFSVSDVAQCKRDPL